MADLSADLLLGIGVVVVAAVAIFMFLRASNWGKKKEETAPIPESQPKTEQLNVGLKVTESRVKVPGLEKKIAQGDVEKARSQIRTLTLKQEINSMVLRRLFEAEDESEISREERVHLGKPYEDEMTQIASELKRSEMLVSLADLESIREEIVKKFEESLSQTQGKIDLILKELKIEPPKPVEEEKPKLPTPAPRKRHVAPKREGEVTEGEEAEDETEGEEKPTAPKQDVEVRLEQLKKEVMKELEELDKMELEA